MWEFDPDKDAANRRKHGVSLALGAEVLDDPRHVIWVDRTANYGEDRYLTIGMVGGEVYVAIFAERADRIRFISVRRADRRETEIYFRGHE